MPLRPYQQQAVDKLLWSASLEGNDLISLPTGSGKSLVIASIASGKDSHVLILQPTREILLQNMSKLSQVIPEDEIGAFSASLNLKNIKKYTFATIGSIYRRPEDFKHFKLVIIDECHLVNPKSLGSMFMELLKNIGNPKVIGLTATPYRLCQQYMRNEYGGVYTITTIKLINRIKERFWSRLIFNINVGDLINQDYLCPLEYHHVKLIAQENIAMNKSRSDFDLEKYGRQISDKEEQITKIINGVSRFKKSVLVFCPSVDDAEKWSKLVKGSEVISAKTKKKERIRIIDGFKSGEIKSVFNVGVLTTGFDHPGLDCIVLLRPTRSIGLYYQMVGRGLRKSPGKKFCTIVDMTDTVNKLGRVETIKLEKIEGKWELVSEKGSWHGRELYRFEVNK